MTTGGTRVLVPTLPGSTATSPLLVGNHSRPSSVRQDAGWNPPEHSSVGKPSLSPYVRQCNCFIWPSAQRLSSAWLTLMMPPWELIQKYPRPSSSMAQMMSFCSPCSFVMATKRPSLSRFSPLNVPIQSVPSLSRWRHCTKSLDRPSPRRNCRRTPCWRRPSPPPDMPNHKVPSGASITVRTSGKASSGSRASQVILPGSYRIKPMPVPMSNLRWAGPAARESGRRNLSIPAEIRTGIRSTQTNCHPRCRPRFGLARPARPTRHRDV